MEVAQRDLRQPFRQVRVQKKHAQRSVRIKAQNGLQEREQSGGRPGLRGIGMRIKSGKGVVVVARVTGEHLRQTIKIKKTGGLKLGAGEAFGLGMKTVAHEAQGEGALL